MNSSMAPIDIVIDIIKQYKTNAEEAYRNCEHKNDVDMMAYYQGKFNTCDELLTEFEDFKKLFS